MVRADVLAANDVCVITEKPLCSRGGKASEMSICGAAVMRFISVVALAERCVAGLHVWVEKNSLLESNIKNCDRKAVEYSSSWE